MKVQYKIQVTGEELDLIIETLAFTAAFDKAQGPLDNPRIAAIQALITYLKIMMDERTP